MHKEIDLQKEISGYTFNDFIAMIEKTENEEEKRRYVDIINSILEKEQIQVISNNILYTH